MKIFLMITALLAISTPAAAEYYSTEYLKKLLDNCSALAEPFDASTENFHRVKDCGLSSGYILGIFDSHNVIADRSKCFPSPLQSEEVVATVETWLRKHPEQQNAPADESVMSAFRQSWPCEGD
jgi:hypothetical protein